MTTTAYKVFTHDLRPPVQGGDPVWDGTLPHRLPEIEVDKSTAKCAPGWNACATPEDALRIAGLWPNGRPSRLFRLETGAQVFARENKLRASTWRILEEIDPSEAIGRLSEEWFGELAGVMTAEQIAWRLALGRPERNQPRVEAGLVAALQARGLSDWRLREYEEPWDAMAAMAAWDARAARAAWTAWDARAAWDAWDAWDARGSGGAWGAWTAWTAWDARDARVALISNFVRRKGWPVPAGEIPDLTVGLRDAYHCGLAIAVPTGPKELGYAMVTP